MRISDWSSDVCSSDLPEWTPMFERPNALLQIARDDDGAYWLGSQRGLWRVQPDEIPVPVPLGGPGIVQPMSALLRTDDGALWVPVAGAGVDRKSGGEGNSVSGRVEIGGRLLIKKKRT